MEEAPGAGGLIFQLAARKSARASNDINICTCLEPTSLEWGSNKAMVEGKDIHAPSNRGPFDIAEHVIFLADGNADATSQVPEKNATNFPSGGYRNRVGLVLWQ